MNAARRSVAGSIERSKKQLSCQPAKANCSPCQGSLRAGMKAALCEAELVRGGTASLYPSAHPPFQGGIVSWGC